MNLLGGSQRALYLVTGRWSELAVEAASRVGSAREAWSGRERGFDRVPVAGAYAADPDAAYLHFTSNNTIYGTEYHALPAAAGATLVCDMSSASRCPPGRSTTAPSFRKRTSMGPAARSNVPTTREKPITR